MDRELTKTIDHLCLRIGTILDEARELVYSTANSEMVKAYWEVGREIVEGEQNGLAKAAYGQQLMKALSVRLTRERGKGFSLSNLFNMRRFYQSYQNSRRCLEN